MDKIDKLIQSYRSANPAVKAKALDLTLRITDRRLTPIFLKAFDEAVSFPVIAALKRTADPSLIPPMIAYLEHSDPWRRAGACDVLGAIGDTAATLPLLGRLKDPYLWTQVAAVRALTRIKDQRSAEPLLERYLEARGDSVNLVWALEAALDELGVAYQRHSLSDDDTL